MGMAIPPSDSQDWKFYAFRSIDDLKKTNNRVDVLYQRIDQKTDALDQKISQKVDALDQKINQQINAMDRSINERIHALERKIDENIFAMDQKYLTTMEDLSQLVGNHHQDVIQLKEELGNQQRQTKIFVDTVDQLKGALEEDRGVVAKQEIKLDRIRAAIDVDHGTLIGLAGDIEHVKAGGTLELSRVNNEIATKAGKKEMQQHLRALRAEGRRPSATEEHGQGKMLHPTGMLPETMLIGAVDPQPRPQTASLPQAQDSPQDSPKGPVPRRNRMALKRKVDYDFKRPQGRSGGRFLDY